ncbi:MAG: SprB repeat-containing protein [Cytophagaceae bacterium]
MSVDIQEMELIDRFLRNELSGQELSSFESRLLSDNYFREQVDTQRFINESFVEYQLEDLYKKLESRNPYKNKFRGLKNLGIIISGMLLVGLIIFVYKNYTTSFNETSDQSLTIDADISEPVDIPIINDVTGHGSISYNSKKTPEIIPADHGKIIEVAQPEKKEKTFDGDSESEPIIPQIENPLMVNKEEVKENKSLLKDCNEGIKADFMVTETCYDKPGGKILFSKVNGGTPPYLYSIDGGRSFHNSGEFHNLSSNNYILIIKDNNGCQSIVNSQVRLEGKDCNTTLRYSFNPDMETWKFPMKEENGSIQIVNASGIVVYSARITNSFPSEWNGRSMNGSDLNSDIYMFLISYDNGKVDQGYISIVR